MKNDGGFAYPQGIDHHGGMTLRERAAIAAMQGMLANHTILDAFFQELNVENLSVAAISHADDLIEELAKQEEPNGT